ncbi:MAG: hypothetical protein HFE73_07370 [Firmicutes bacterium]|nr:hypothetical protein [Bacillota bacterium]
MKVKEYILQEMIRVQREDEAHYLRDESLERMVREFQVTKSFLQDAASFYGDLSLVPRGTTIIKVCTSPVCHFAGKRELIGLVEELTGAKMGETSADGKYFLEPVGCLGACDLAPVMMVDDTLYGNLTEEKIKEILGHGVEEDDTVEEDLSWNMDDFQGLKRAVTLSGQEIIQELEVAGLTGRGGAGFPAAVKWRTVREAPGQTKYIVCNGDEGEPGTFKDRYILQRDPWKVVEGMVIAAYATGASQGYIYLRGEYYYLYERFCRGLTAMEEKGLLGKNILGRGFDFHVVVRMGAGAYICGEETALLESLEGGRGQVRTKPSIPALRGLHGKPTLINNVETFLCAAEVLEQGADAYEDKKYVCISGCVNGPGVYRVPFGLSLMELLEKYGGGIREGARLQFLHIGGLTGGCVDGETALELFYDKAALHEVGLSVGTGAIFAADENVDLLEYMDCGLDFYCRESCGKCTPCREGLYQLRRELGEYGRSGEETTSRRIYRLLDTMEAGSNCGLGQGVPRFIRSALKLYERSKKV